VGDTPESDDQEPAAVLTIGEVVKRSGVAASALRFYEERGLIRSIRAGRGVGHRRYGRHVLRQIAFIVFAQRIGLTLERIGELLAPQRGAPRGAEWERIATTWNATIDARIAELERLRRGLGECIGCGCLSTEKCPLANPADRAGRAGAGPRYWLGDPIPAAALTGSARRSRARRR
jgi:MerR family transcriptional regulator, redox-sensitive transcriptional activator SoxR